MHKMFRQIWFPFFLTLISYSTQNVRRYQVPSVVVSKIGDDALQVKYIPSVEHKPSGYQVPSGNQEQNVEQEPPIVVSKIVHLAPYVEQEPSVDERVNGDQEQNVDERVNVDLEPFNSPIIDDFEVVKAAAHAFNSSQYVIHDIEPLKHLKEISVAKRLQNVIYNQCGAHLTEYGAAVCDGCTDTHTVDQNCYYLLETNGGGQMHLNLNVTNLTGATIQIYFGEGGRNIPQQLVNEAINKSFIVPGASALLVLRISADPPPKVSFEFDFITVGTEIQRTGGCGGQVYDKARIQSPKCRTSDKCADFCVWQYYSSSGSAVIFNVSRPTNIAQFPGSLKLFDGTATTDPLIAEVKIGYDQIFQAESGKMLIVFDLENAPRTVGFTGFFSSR